MERVSTLLKQSEEEARAAKDQLCHPLCNCQHCTALEDRFGQHMTASPNVGRCSLSSDVIGSYMLIYDHTHGVECSTMLLSEYPTRGNCLSNPTRGNPNMKPLPPHPMYYIQADGRLTQSHCFLSRCGRSHCPTHCRKNR